MMVGSDSPHTGVRVPVAHATRLEPGAGTVVLLAAMAGIGQFAAGVYTPSLPEIARSFNEDLSSVQLTLAVYLAAFALGQLIFGPLADRFGRRPVLFSGFGLFLVGTLACALSPDLATLMCARAFQALGAASTIVIARTAARDSFDGFHLVRLTAIVMAAFALVPGASPLVGAAALEVGGWRTNFWLTLGVGAFILSYTYFKLPETGESRLTRLDIKGISDGFSMIARDRMTRYGMFAGAMAFGTVSAFNTGAPALYIGRFGLSPAEFGLYPFLSAAAIVAGSICARRSATGKPHSRIAGWGLALMVSGLALMLLFPALGLVHEHVFTVTLIVYSVGFGLFIPIVNAMISSRFSHNRGFVSSALGFLFLSGAALGAIAVSLAQTALPIMALPLTMLILAAAAGATSPAYLIDAGNGTGITTERPARKSL